MCIDGHISWKNRFTTLGHFDLDNVIKFLKKLASKSSLNNDIQLGFKAPPVTLNMLNQTNMTGGGNLVA